MSASSGSPFSVSYGSRRADVDGRRLFGGRFRPRLPGSFDGAPARPFQSGALFLMPVKQRMRGWVTNGSGERVAEQQHFVAARTGSDGEALETMATFRVFVAQRIRERIFENDLRIDVFNVVVVV